MDKRLFVGLLRGILLVGILDLAVNVDANDIPTVRTSMIGATQVGIGDYLFSVRPGHSDNLRIVCSTQDAADARLTILHNTTSLSSTRQIPGNAYTEQFDIDPSEEGTGIHYYSCRVTVTSEAYMSVIETSVRLEVISPAATTASSCTSSLGTHGFGNETTVINFSKGGLVRAVDCTPITQSTTTPLPLCGTPFEFSACTHFANETFFCRYENESLSRGYCTIQLHQEQALHVRVEPTAFDGDSDRDVDVFNCSTQPPTSRLRWRIFGNDRVNFTVNQTFGTSLLTVDVASIRRAGISSVECEATRSGFRRSAESVRRVTDRPTVSDRQPPSQTRLPFASTETETQSSVVHPASVAPESMNGNASLLLPVVGSASAGICLALFVVALVVVFACVACRKTSEADVGDIDASSVTIPASTDPTANPAYKSYDDESQQDPTNLAHISAADNPSYQLYDYTIHQYNTQSDSHPPNVYEPLHPAAGDSYSRH